MSFDPKEEHQVKTSRNIQKDLTTMIRRRDDVDDIRGASRILSGNDNLTPLNKETKTALQAKHPKGPTP